MHDSLSPAIVKCICALEKEVWHSLNDAAIGGGKLRRIPLAFDSPMGEPLPFIYALRSDNLCTM
jgi:hypothetical protein